MTKEISSGVKIAVNGALGRMGTRILHLACQSQDFKVVGAYEHAKHDALGKELGDVLGLGESLKVRISTLSVRALKGADVMIDFSSPEGVEASLKTAQAANTGLVIGTTGVGADELKEIKKASKKIAVLFSPNMSIGANFLFEIVRTAAVRLRSGYDIEILEAHHRLKKDAPSGTAKKIAQIIAEEKGWDLNKVTRYGREGLIGERPVNELGIHVIRAGDIVGEHTILFSGPGETIELKHTALSRDAFAKGALVAALFVFKKKNGLYTMSDVLR
ncbi:MAG: 4-hydroxy-tetrahydrodipicolinate reductase [Candidatus Omnitrophica bacterium CG1_02_46_14]|nr:MAG: 4-hydroxy-tetrahydrodipicolinate reductase [Candidatus Omnitrophica bacterium CG1_02_46_14]